VLPEFLLTVPQRGYSFTVSCRKSADNQISGSKAQYRLRLTVIGKTVTTMKSYTPRAGDIERSWYVVDAEGKTLGRLASQIAHVLRGKHKPTYSPHMDLGDHIVVVNAEKIHVTGRKAEQKVYYRHTGYPGGLRTSTYEDVLNKHPERILRTAIKGMMPNNVLGRQMFKKLRVYAGAEHGHAAQQPQVLEL
jgi:large subunit ribosomal protein L13